MRDLESKCSTRVKVPLDTRITNCKYELYQGREGEGGKGEFTFCGAGQGAEYQVLDIAFLGQSEFRD
jgi:hypothetical protein